MTTARAIVRSLVANGVDTVFGLPGIQLDALPLRHRAADPRGASEVSE